MKQEQILRAALAGLVPAGIAAATQPAFAAKGDIEKCAGIVKAGKNDCGTSTNAWVAQRQLDARGDAMRVTQLVRFADGTSAANVAVYRRHAPS